MNALVTRLRSATAGRALRRLERRQVRDRGAWLCLALFFVFAGAGLALGVSDAKQNRFGVPSPGSEREEIALPPSVLQPVSVGHSDLLPGRATPFSEYDVATRWPTQALPGASTIQDLYTDTVGHFDVAFVLVWLTPLLVIALSYDLLSREREEGTFALVLSQPVTARQVVAAKTMARLPWILVPAMVVYAAACVSRLPEMTARAWILAGAGAILVLAYVVLWLAFSVWVNSRRYPSHTNGLILAVAWLVVVVVLPPGLDAVARARYPRPTIAEIELRDGSWRREVAYGNPSHDAYYQRLLRERPEVGPARPMSPDPVRARNYGEDGGRALAYYYYAYQDLAGVVATLAQRFTDRQTLLDRIRYVSPAAVLKDSLDEVAGTHERRYRAFERQVRAYFDDIRAREWVREFKVQSLSSLGAVQEQARAALERELGPPPPRPLFRFVEDPAGAVARRFVGALASLVLPALVCAGATWRTLRAPVSGSLV